MGRVRGFISLPLVGAGVMAAIIAVMGIALKVQTVRLSSEKEAHAATAAQFAGFKAETKRLGEEAKAKADAERKRQEQVNRKTVTSYEKRLAAVNDTYRRLRDQRASAGSGAMPAVPDAARPANDAARDQRLLDLLQHAEKQTAQLIELQEWIRATENK